MAAVCRAQRRVVRYGALRLPYLRIGDVRGVHHHGLQHTIRPERQRWRRTWSPLCNVPRDHVARMADDAASWNPVLTWEKQPTRLRLPQSSLTLVASVAVQVPSQTPTCSFSLHLYALPRLGLMQIFFSVYGSDGRCAFVEAPLQASILALEDILGTNKLKCVFTLH
jgi:hypothetical protein